MEDEEPVEIHFPRPCHERWGTMRALDRARHCSACDRPVHDLAQLTAEEASELMASEESACFRAKVSADGMVKALKNGEAERRNLVAPLAATMSISLALAACQTPLLGPVSPRFEVTGLVPAQYTVWKIELTSSAGRIYSTRLDRNRSFKLTNLQPGTYSLRINGECGEWYDFDEIVIRESDIALGSLKWEEADCIIIGMMSPLERKGLG